MSYAYVTSGANGGSGSSTSGSVTLNTTGADRIFVAVSQGQNATAGFTDSKSNTYTQVEYQTSITGFQASIALYMSQDNPSVGSGHAFTSDTAFGPSIAVLAVRGSVSSPLDTHKGAVNDSATSLQPGSITPAQANEIFVAAIGIAASGSADTASCDSGFSTAGTVNGVTGVTYGIGLFYLIQTTATAENPHLSTVTVDSLAVCQACFKAASSSSTSPLFRQPLLNGISTGGPFFANPLG